MPALGPDSLRRKIIRHVADCCRGVYSSVLWLFIGAFEIVREHRSDRRLGIETAGPFDFKDRFSRFGDGASYGPTPYRVLEALRGRLALSPRDVLVDLGCGKGRVVLFFSMLKLERILGIEMHEGMLAAARENIGRFCRGVTPMELIHGDAVDFPVTKETVFFMFNPFGEKTLQRVLDNIKDSLASNPRAIRIVYYAPQHRDLLDRQDWLVLEDDMEGVSCAIWANRPNGKKILPRVQPKAR